MAIINNICLKSDIKGGGYTQGNRDLHNPSQGMKYEQLSLEKRQLKR